MSTTPGLLARIAGVLYLVVTTAAFSLFVRTSLIVPGDAAETARQVLTSEPLYRLALVTDIVAFASYIGVTGILYGLLRPVSRTFSFTAALSSLAGCAVSAANLVNYAAPLVFLSGASYLTSLAPDQLQALALASLKLHAQGYVIAHVFFGLYCFLIGWLIVGSMFLPRLLGALMVVGGACYLVNSFAIFLSPEFAARLFPLILVPPGIAELGLTAWLIVFGVNSEKWKAQAGVT